jgi:hypothetical protein
MACACKSIQVRVHPETVKNGRKGACNGSVRLRERRFIRGVYPSGDDSGNRIGVEFG